MSWESLLSIYQAAADELRAERDTPPVACPLCGEPLRTGPRAELFCAFDGWQHAG